MKLNAEVKKINPCEKVVLLANGEKISFDKLLLATGSKAKVVHGNALDYKNVLTLRSAEDHAAIKR